MRITNTSDKTLKIIADQLVEMGLLKALKEGVHMYYHVNFPIKYTPVFFPGFYSGDKEADMVRLF